MLLWRKIRGESGLFQRECSARREKLICSGMTDCDAHHPRRLQDYVSKIREIQCCITRKECLRPSLLLSLSLGGYSIDSSKVCQETSSLQYTRRGCVFVAEVGEISSPSVYRQKFLPSWTCCVVDHLWIARYSKLCQEEEKQCIKDLSHDTGREDRSSWYFYDSDIFTPLNKRVTEGEGEAGNVPNYRTSVDI